MKEKEFILNKGESSTTGELNNFLNYILEDENSFWKGRIYSKSYKVKIIVKELKCQ
jgi:hypothetical protein